VPRVDLDAALLRLGQCKERATGGERAREQRALDAVIAHVEEADALRRRAHRGTGRRDRRGVVAGKRATSTTGMSSTAICVTVA